MSTTFTNESIIVNGHTTLTDTGVDGSTQLKLRDQKLDLVRNNDTVFGRFMNNGLENDSVLTWATADGTTLGILRAAYPEGDQDVATKSYVDDKTKGVAVLGSVSGVYDQTGAALVFTDTFPTEVTGLSKTVDGYEFKVADRILLTNGSGVNGASGVFKCTGFNANDPSLMIVTRDASMQNNEAAIALNDHVVKVSAGLKKGNSYIQTAEVLSNNVSQVWDLFDTPGDYTAGNGLNLDETDGSHRFDVIVKSGGGLNLSGVSPDQQLEIADLGVITEKIAVSAVTTEKIAASAVSFDRINADANHISIAPDNNSSLITTNGTSNDGLIESTVKCELGGVLKIKVNEAQYVHPPTMFDASGIDDFVPVLEFGTAADTVTNFMRAKPSTVKVSVDRTNVKKYNVTGIHNLTLTGELDAENAVLSTSVQVSSDERKKENIEVYDVSKIHQFVDSTPCVRYNYIADEKKTTRVGVIAQRVREFLPEAVNETEAGFYTVDYNSLTAALLTEVAHLRKRVALLEK